MNDPLDLLVAGVTGLVGQDQHELADTALLCSSEQILTVINQLNGVLARRLQVMHVRDVTTAECGRKTRNWLIEDQHLGHEYAAKLMTVAKSVADPPRDRSGAARR